MTVLVTDISVFDLACDLRDGLLSFGARLLIIIDVYEHLELTDLLLNLRDLCLDLFFLQLLGEPLDGRVRTDLVLEDR